MEATNANATTEQATPKKKNPVFMIVLACWSLVVAGLGLRNTGTACIMKKPMTRR